MSGGRGALVWKCIAKYYLYLFVYNLSFLETLLCLSLGDQGICAEGHCILWAHLNPFESLAFELQPHFSCIGARREFFFSSLHLGAARRRDERAEFFEHITCTAVAPCEIVQWRWTKVRACEKPFEFPHVRFVDLDDILGWKRPQNSDYVRDADWGSHTESYLTCLTFKSVHVIPDFQRHAAWPNFTLMKWYRKLWLSWFFFTCWPSELPRTKPAVLLAGPAMMEGGRNRHNRNSSKSIKKDDSPI